jgi:hypothetical protein
MSERSAVDSDRRRFEMGEIGKPHLSRSVFLSEHYFFRGAARALPLSDPFLQSPQLRAGVFAGVFLL